MLLRSRVFKGAALAAMMLVPAVAYADVNGAVGTLRSVSVNEPKSDNYAAEHGSIIVEESSQTRKYQWGGAACSGRLVSDSSVALLVRAMENRDTVQIVPSYKSVAGGLRCLVGFRLERIPTPSVR